MPRLPGGRTSAFHPHIKTDGLGIFPRPGVCDMTEHYKIVIAGSGGIGWAAGLILRELGDFTCDLFLGDMDLEKARKEADRITDGSERPGQVAPFLLPAGGVSAGFSEVLQGAHVLLDCLPGGEAPRMARLAREHTLHYVHLTEYVA